MTTTPLTPDDREREALRLYAHDPLDDGDAVVLLDGTTCLEVSGMADEWDAGGRDGLLTALRGADRVLVAVARPGAELLPGDYRLWRDLHRSLQDTGVELLPVRALPAA